VSPIGRFCTAADCIKAAAPDQGGLCDAHAKRKKRNQPLSSKLAERNRSPLQYLLDSALGYAEVSSEDEKAYKRSVDVLTRAAIRYALANPRRRWDLSKGLKVEPTPEPTRHD
jgi:uncharacterized membrane protein